MALEFGVELPHRAAAIVPALHDVAMLANGSTTESSDDMGDYEDGSKDSGGDDDDDEEEEEEVEEVEPLLKRARSESSSTPAQE
ncbi:hypothetical protein DQ04_11831010 [Trypanosoma grayi]|uniref:hypothetical protein n=1 Tax=Trypanosoma grayi TaxID=71804 RepID=UPI0004F47844|nr:hypothetical protein DQ04_11831010 [Trypanosoma grayi]KEG06874.1 hypothetical protein DQ04_11831010 [Trypanosoma grayi]